MHDVVWKMWKGMERRGIGNAAREGYSAGNYVEFKVRVGISPRTPAPLALVPKTQWARALGLGGHGEVGGLVI